MTEAGKSQNQNRDFLLPWKTQRARFPHSHCPDGCYSLLSNPTQKGASSAISTDSLQAHLSIGKDYRVPGLGAKSRGPNLMFG